MGIIKLCPICLRKPQTRKVYCSQKCLKQAEIESKRETELLEKQRLNLIVAYQNEKMRRELLISKELYPDMIPIVEYIEVVDEGMVLKQKKLLTTYKRRKRYMRSTRNLQRVV
jgi:hypothetical protein